MKYKLLVDNGFYESENFISLLYEMFKHRMYHLIHHKKWID